MSVNANFSSFPNITSNIDFHTFYMFQSNSYVNIGSLQIYFVAESEKIQCAKLPEPPQHHLAAGQPVNQLIWKFRASELESLLYGYYSLQDYPFMAGITEVNTSGTFCVCLTVELYFYRNVFKNNHAAFHQVGTPFVKNQEIRRPRRVLGTPSPSR